MCFNAVYIKMGGGLSMENDGMIRGNGWKERPQCQVPGCKNGALVMIGSLLVCGECAVKWDAKEKERINAHLLSSLSKEVKE